MAVAAGNDPGTDNANYRTILCVGICRGAVAVHTKTMRLESPRSVGVGVWRTARTIAGTPPQ